MSDTMTSIQIIKARLAEMLNSLSEVNDGHDFEDIKAMNAALNEAVEVLEQYKKQEITTTHAFGCKSIETRQNDFCDCKLHRQALSKIAKMLSKEKK